MVMGVVVREGVAVGVAVYRAWLAAAWQEEQGLSTLFHRETLRARMARRGFRDRSFLTGPMPFLAWQEWHEGVTGITGES